MCGITVAILAFFLRLGASLLKNGRTMSWDDATMGMVVALSIPPAVFAFFCKLELLWARYPISTLASPDSEQ
jgi:hypothetical protein